MKHTGIDIDALLYPQNQEPHYTVDERQERALDVLQKNGRITNWEYVNLCNVGYRTAHRDLADLISQGHIEIVKMGRSTYYRLIH